MTTITDMLTSRPGSAAKGSTSDAFGIVGAEDRSTTFADVFDEVAEPARRSTSESESVTRRDEDPQPRQEKSVRASEDDSEEEVESVSSEDEETAVAEDDEQEQTYVPLGDASMVPVAPESEAGLQEEQAAAPATTAWQRVQPDEGRQSSRAERSVAPAEVATSLTADGVQMAAGAQNAGQQNTDSALDLLTAQELMSPDQIQVDTEGGELFERLQQALATGSTVLADDVGEVVVPQVVRNMAALARNGVSEMRLQLQPGDLGEIELRVRALEGVVRGEVMVQHPDVKALLDTQMDRLRAALAMHGLELEGFDVGVWDQGAQSRGDGDGEATQGRTSSGGSGSQESDDADPRLATTAPGQPVRLDPNANDWLV